MPRRLRCRGCEADLGTVHGETLKPREGLRIAIDLAARRVRLTCAACGTVREWRDGCVYIERSRVIDSGVTDEAATGRR